MPMGEKEEKKTYRKKKWIFFLTAVGIYFAVFLFQYAMLSLVDHTVGTHPYVRLALLVIFLIDSAWLMKRAMESDYIQEVLD